ncbi:hypothetical protein BGY98DRAFT_1085217 [Russula aff. rugulosa BPL654]|nr:hypothetical protein BGY98DRAFT_1085217 [Russula aff. rugulosa BPL654]
MWACFGLGSLACSRFSAATVIAVGLTCKAYLHSGLCFIFVHGLQYLLDALSNNSKRRDGTRHPRDPNNSEDHNRTTFVPPVSDHISTLDDPLTWGILRVRTYLHSHLTHWTLGASEILFTNPVFSIFFRKGQIIETFRGEGIYQPAVDLAMEKLCVGAWIHLFGEGKVCQSDTYKADPQTGIARLQRFRWGIGRILMETHRLPTIIPMRITGTSISHDPPMPEGRRAPWKFLPLPGARLSVTFGAPLSPVVVRATMASVSGLAPAPWCDNGAGGKEQSTGMPVNMDAEAEVKVRIALTELMRHAVEVLGRQVSGDSLTGLPHHHHHRT